jgi:hypothetical protein
MNAESQREFDTLDDKVSEAVRWTEENAPKSQAGHVWGFPVVVKEERDPVLEAEFIE